MIPYSRRVLSSHPEYEVVECSWVKGSTSPWHNHGWSRCSVTVLEGQFENTLRCGAHTETSHHGPGEIISNPIGSQHEFRCVSETGKTLHHYFPKIVAHDSRTDALVVKPEGLLASVAKLSDKASTVKELKACFDEILAGSLATHSPKFMNQLFSGVWPTAFLSAELATQLRTTLATSEASPALTSIEMELIEQLVRLSGWSDERAGGISVPGGSAANIMALHCAKFRLCPEARLGHWNPQQFEIYCSDQAHYSVKKAALATGLGLEAVREVESDNRGRMLVSALADQVATASDRGRTPLAVFLTAGTTVLGAFDHLGPLQDQLKRQKIWIHVDGAWGGPALFSNAFPELRQTVWKADSWCLDSHKLLGANLAHSFFLLRDEHILLHANDVSDGGYLFHDSKIRQSRGRLSWQCGRGPDFLHFWAIWKLMGSSGLGAFVDRQCQVARQVANWVKEQAGLELVVEPEFLNVGVRILGPNQTRLTGAQLQSLRENLVSCNIAMVNMAHDSQGSFLRFIVAHPEQELSHFVRAMEHCQRWAQNQSPAVKVIPAQI